MSLPLSDDFVLDHIAIAVKSIAITQKIYEDMGLTFSNLIEEVKEQKVLTSFAQIDQNAHIELLQPTSDESTIHKFIESKGEGIHHLCFKVPDVKAKTFELHRKDINLFIQNQGLVPVAAWLILFIQNQLGEF